MKPVCHGRGTPTHVGSTNGAARGALALRRDCSRMRSGRPAVARVAAVRDHAAGDAAAPGGGAPPGPAARAAPPAAASSACPNQPHTRRQRSARRCAVRRRRRSASRRASVRTQARWMRRAWWFEVETVRRCCCLLRCDAEATARLQATGALLRCTSERPDALQPSDGGTGRGPHKQGSGHFPPAAAPPRRAWRSAWWRGGRARRRAARPAPDSGRWALKFGAAWGELLRPRQASKLLRQRSGLLLARPEPSDGPGWHGALSSGGGRRPLPPS